MATAVQWTQCILIKCDEDDFGVSDIFLKSQEVQCLLYADIFFYETTNISFWKKYGDLYNLSYLHVYFIS